MTEVEVSGIRLNTVGPDNLSECGIGCLTNPGHEGFGPQVEWLHKRFDEGLRFLLFRNEKGKPLAFLEYVPGEHAWRPVDAGGWLFVHCLWVYGVQCPMLPKSVNDLGEMAAEHGLELKVTVLDTPEKAQRAPSYYGVFNLVWDGRLLADHYVSKGRFKNILRKEILKAT